MKINNNIPSSAALAGLGACFWPALAIAAFLLIVEIPIALAEKMPSQKEMWEMLNTQQKEISELKKQLKQTDEKAEAVTEAVESQSSGASGGGAGSWSDSTQVGGYGELHYNGGEKDEVDFHRFVLFVNHQFSDKIRFFSEFELEHALSGDEKDGEVELEQGYVEFDVAENHRILAGLSLVPVGILNETHEPPTFFGVERNPVESNIIPTTWWEAGIAVKGDLPANFAYDLAFHSGLETPIEDGNAFKIRNGRQKVSKATAKDGAVTARVKWNGVSGVELGVAGQYQNDVTQRQLNENISAILLSTTADIRKGPFGFRGLYAHWDLDGDAPKAIGRDEQEGWYVEPSYYFGTPIGEMGVFGRYNAYDNEAGNSADSEFEQIDVGINYWPHSNVVLKVDMAFVNPPAGGTDDEILNLGVGVAF
ncbi:porin [Oligoflexia bacterium]|nr:porin [Oligoflexia bacterium]